MMWNKDQMFEAIAVLEPIATKFGLHIGVCGSVLHKGESDDDLDLVVFPLKTTNFDWFGFQTELNSIGFAEWQDRTPYHQPEDTKEVKASVWNGKRIDWFIFTT